MDGRYIRHENLWWWGSTIDFVKTDGTGIVTLQFDKKYPYHGFIKGLSVVRAYRNQGIATELLKLCEDEARLQGCRFLQLDVDKREIWLQEWYKSLGFETIFVDDHEYTMLKVLYNVQCG